MGLKGNRRAEYFRIVGYRAGEQVAEVLQGKGVLLHEIGILKTDFLDPPQGHLDFVDGCQRELPGAFLNRLEYRVFGSQMAIVEGGEKNNRRAGEDETPRV